MLRRPADKMRRASRLRDVLRGPTDVTVAVIMLLAVLPAAISPSKATTSLMPSSSVTAANQASAPPDPSSQRYNNITFTISGGTITGSKSSVAMPGTPTTYPVEYFVTPSTPTTNITISASAPGVPSQYGDTSKKYYQENSLDISYFGPALQKTPWTRGTNTTMVTGETYKGLSLPSKPLSAYLSAALVGSFPAYADVDGGAYVVNMTVTLGETLYSWNAAILLNFTQPGHPPIILIPGVGGTELDDSSNGEEVWPCPGGTTACVTTKLVTTPQPSWWGAMTLTADGSGGSSRIAVADILRSWPTNFYGGMISYLVDKLGYKEKYDLNVFPYDWRLDLRLSYPALSSLINSTLDTTKAVSVILLAHSMGGVLARSFLINKPWMASKVSALITMGSPIWGTNRAFDALVYGYTFGDPAVSQQTMKVLAQNYPSVYELLPWNNYFLQDLSLTFRSFSQIQSISYPGLGCGGTVPPSPLTGSAGLTLLQCQSGMVAGGTWTPNPALIDMSKAFWANLGTPANPTPLPGATKYYVIIGYGVKTFGDYESSLAAGSPTAADAQLSGRGLNFTPLPGDGDGTVGLDYAQISAATATYYIQNVEGTLSGVSARHVDLPQNPDVQKIVASIVNGKPLDPSSYQYKGDVSTSMAISLHSNVQMTMVDPSTHATMGYNRLGGINSSLGSGSFIDMNGVEYAAFQNVSRPYEVVVNGTGSGQFTLGVNVTQGKQTIALFRYLNVTAFKATSAQVTVDTKQILAKQSAPVLQVYQGGAVTQVSASQVKLAPAGAVTSLTSSKSSISTSTVGAAAPTIVFTPTLYEAAAVAVLLVVVVSALAVRSRRAKRQEYVAPPQQAQQPVYRCNYCGATLQWVPQYQRYYCPREGRYV